MFKLKNVNASNKFYLDMNSTWRNRKGYPKVGDFVLNTNSNIQSTAVTAQDPVLLAFPYETNLCQGGSTALQIALSVTSQNIINYYSGSFLQIGTEFRKIISYDAITQFVTVDSPFSAAPPALTQYSIRYELPVPLSGGNYFDTTPYASVNNTTIVLGPLTTPNVQQYTNNWIFVPGTSAPTSYQWSRLEGFFTGLVNITVTNPGAGYVSPPTVTITGDGQGATATAVIAAGQVIAINIISSGAGYTFANITLSGGGGLGATANATIGTLGMVADPFKVNIPAGAQYQILRFSYNNISPLNFQKTSTFNNASNVDIRLVNLVVPNLPIQGSYFGTLQNYPYLYVSLYSETQSSYNNVLITNHPNGDVRSKALFIVPVTYLQNNSFLTLSSTAMTQTISLRENDDLRMVIQLPDGTVLDFVSLDPTVYPTKSNPFVQVRAIFEINHIH
jgi:hypothetical protein